MNNCTNYNTKYRAQYRMTVFTLIQGSGKYSSIKTISIVLSLAGVITNRNNDIDV